MLITEARVETERSRWYLEKLCRHFAQKAEALPDVDYNGDAHPPVTAHVQWADGVGVASFGWGRCTLRADADSLIVRAEAPDQQHLRRVESLVGNHLERFGRRERLAVEWTPPQRSADGHPSNEHITAEGNRHD